MALSSRQAPDGITAVLFPGDGLDRAILDLAAVLEGLVGDRFEILVVSNDALLLADMPSRAPGLPLKVLNGATIADACAAARFNLVLVAAPDGQYDVRELNHLLDAILAGADLAVGYRPRPGDVLARQLERFGWSRRLDVAFALLRRDFGEPGTSLGALPALARRRGYRVAEVQVAHRRPVLGAPVSATYRAA